MSVMEIVVAVVSCPAMIRTMAIPAIWLLVMSPAGSWLSRCPRMFSGSGSAASCSISSVTNRCRLSSSGWNFSFGVSRESSLSVTDWKNGWCSYPTPSNWQMTRLGMTRLSEVCRSQGGPAAIMSSAGPVRAVFHAVDGSEGTAIPRFVPA